MRGLLRFLVRYHTTILFFLLEILAFVLIARYSSFHRVKLFRLRYAVVGSIAKKYGEFSDYLDLERENKELEQENVRLYNLLPPSYFNPMVPYSPDSTHKQFIFMGARVVNNSTNKQYNFLTLNKGRLDGIEPEMAVICSEGIVGMVKETTDHFSSVISILNGGFHPSAKLKNSGYFGPIDWAGRRYDEVVLTEIPLHVKINVGDTVVTTGYSGIFPEGIMVGTVLSYKSDQGISYRVKLKLSTDLKRLSNVLVVENKLRKEQRKIEEEADHD